MNLFRLNLVICILAVWHTTTSAVAQASPVSETSPAPSNITVIRSESCKVDGDSDIYGLGVRIGLYLQWLSGFILRNIGSWDTVTRVRTTNNVLCAALALATAINIVEGKALSIDYLLSYYLTVILFYSESYNLHLEVGEMSSSDKDHMKGLDTEESRWGRHSAKLAYYTLAPDLSLIFQNLFFAAYTLFGAWYWLAGIRLSHGSLCSEDAAIILLFNLHSHRWKIAATFFALLLGIFWTIVFIVNSRGFISVKGQKPGLVITAVFKSYQMACGGEYVVRQYGQPQQMGNRFQRPLWKNYFHYTWLYLLGPFVGIISVERIVASNHISTLAFKQSTGQMISFVTGITSMLCALWELCIWLSTKRVLPRTAHAGASSPVPLQREEQSGTVNSPPPCVAKLPGH